MLANSFHRKVFGLGSLGIAWIILGQPVVRDSFQHLLREDSQQLPAYVQRLKDCTILIRT